MIITGAWYNSCLVFVNVCQVSSVFNTKPCKELSEYNGISKD